MSTTPAIRIVPAPSSRPAGVPLRMHGEREDPAGAGPYVQDSLAVDFAAVGADVPERGRAARSAELPEPSRWAAQVAQALVEVMHGARPPAQVLRWTSPEVYSVVARRGALAARRAGLDLRQGEGVARRVRVRTARVCEPREDVAEASLLVHDGGRLRALALRLEGRDHRWVVTALQVA